MDPGRKRSHLGPLILQLFLCYFTVLTVKPFNTSLSIDNLLLTCIKRVTGRTNFDSQLVGQCRPGDKLIATTAGNIDLLIIGVYFCFHLLCYLATNLSGLGVARITAQRNGRGRIAVHARQNKYRPRGPADSAGGD